MLAFGGGRGATIGAVAVATDGFFVHCEVDIPSAISQVYYFRRSSTQKSITLGGGPNSCSATSLHGRSTAMFFDARQDKLFVADSGYSRLLRFQPFAATSSVTILGRCSANEGGVSSLSLSSPSSVFLTPLDLFWLPGRGCRQQPRSAVPGQKRRRAARSGCRVWTKWALLGQLAQ